nr:hypothetical protein [Tanacetum cinerariifolium]
MCQLGFKQGHMGMSGRGCGTVLVWCRCIGELPGDERMTTDKKNGLDFIEEINAKRDDNKPCRFSEANFKYLNKNDIEDMYYLCLNKKLNYHKNGLLNSLVLFIRSRVIGESDRNFIHNLGRSGKLKI